MCIRDSIEAGVLGVEKAHEHQTKGKGAEDKKGPFFITPQIGPGHGGQGGAPPQMCIRDSAVAVPLWRALDGVPSVRSKPRQGYFWLHGLLWAKALLAAAGALSSGKRSWLVSVSYTHLDVYKRQA